MYGQNQLWIEVLLYFYLKKKRQFRQTASFAVPQAFFFDTHGESNPLMFDTEGYIQCVNYITCWT